MCGRAECEVKCSTRIRGKILFPFYVNEHMYERDVGLDVVSLYSTVCCK